MNTITGRAPATTLPVTPGQLRIILFTEQALHELNGGTWVTWDRATSSLTFRDRPDERGDEYSVVVTLRPASGGRTTVDVTATTTTRRVLPAADRAALRQQMTRDALQESRAIVAHLMDKVAKGVGRGFADRPQSPAGHQGRALAG